MSLDMMLEWWVNNDRLIDLLITALGQTLAMVAIAGLIGFIFGIPLGVLLHLTKETGL